MCLLPLLQNLFCYWNPFTLFKVLQWMTLFIILFLFSLETFGNLRCFLSFLHIFYNFFNIFSKIFLIINCTFSQRIIIFLIILLIIFVIIILFPITFAHTLTMSVDLAENLFNFFYIFTWLHFIVWRGRFRGWWWEDLWGFWGGELWQRLWWGFWKCWQVLVALRGWGWRRWGWGRLADWFLILGLLGDCFGCVVGCFWFLFGLFFFNNLIAFTITRLNNTLLFESLFIPPHLIFPLFPLHLLLIRSPKPNRILPSLLDILRRKQPR